MKQPPELDEVTLMKELLHNAAEQVFCPLCRTPLGYTNTIVIQLLVYEDVWTQWIPFSARVMCDACYDKRIKPILDEEVRQLKLSAFRVLDLRGQWCSAPDLSADPGPKSDPSGAAN